MEANSLLSRIVRQLNITHLLGPQASFTYMQDAFSCLKMFLFPIPICRHWLICTSSMTGVTFLLLPWPLLPHSPVKIFRIFDWSSSNPLENFKEKIVLTLRGSDIFLIGSAIGYELKIQSETKRLWSPSFFFHVCTNPSALLCCFAWANFICDFPSSSHF